MDTLADKFEKNFEFFDQKSDLMTQKSKEEKNLKMCAFMIAFGLHHNKEINKNKKILDDLFPIIPKRYSYTDSQSDALKKLVVFGSKSAGILNIGDKSFKKSKSISIFLFCYAFLVFISFLETIPAPKSLMFANNFPLYALINNFIYLVNISWVKIIAVTLLTPFQFSYAVTIFSKHLKSVSIYPAKKVIDAVSIILIIIRLSQ